MPSGAAGLEAGGKGALKQRRDVPPVSSTSGPVSLLGQRRGPGSDDGSQTVLIKTKPNSSQLPDLGNSGNHGDKDTDKTSETLMGKTAE